MSEIGAASNDEPILSILVGMLCGPVAVEVISELIISNISVLSVGLRYRLSFAHDGM